MNQSNEILIKYLRALSFLNNPKNLDPSYKMDLDFWDCLGRKKLSYSRRNTVTKV